MYFWSESKIYFVSSKYIYSTLSLLGVTLLSADNLCKQFGRSSVSPDLDPLW